MITTVYFVRHCESDIRTREDEIRPLTEKGIRDSQRVTVLLQGRGLHAVYSSPYKRAVDTVRHLSDFLALEVIPVADFRERAVGQWVEDFKAFAVMQWTDMDYKQPGGESLREVQQRNVSALLEVIGRHPGQNIAIGTHGTALCAIRNHFEPGFGLEGFFGMANKMPYMMVFRFRGTVCIGIEDMPVEEAV